MLNELETKRMEELKAKGPYLTLSKEERDEYSALKAKNDVGAIHAGFVQKDPSKFTPDEPLETPKTVTISAKQMDGIMARLDQLEAEKKALQKLPTDGEWKEIDKTSETKTALLRTKNHNYFMGFIKNDEYPKKVMNERTREWEWVYLVKWLQPDGEILEEPEVLTQFIKLEQVPVLLRDRSIVEREMTVGTTRYAIPSDDDYSKYKTTLGEKVPMTVRDQKVYFTVELPDKRKLKVEDSILNA
jgi:hypothetical protein